MPRLGSSKRKVITTTNDGVDLEKQINAHIEERNYLIYSVCNGDTVQIKELWSWSLEALFQYLLATHQKARKEELRLKNANAKKGSR